MVYPQFGHVGPSKGSDSKMSTPLLPMTPLFIASYEGFNIFKKNSLNKKCHKSANFHVKKKQMFYGLINYCSSIMYQREGGGDLTHKITFAHEGGRGVWRGAKFVCAIL